MFINAQGHYVPSLRIGNDYFFNLNGLTSDWILQRTGISTRSRTAEGEDAHTMGLEAIKNAIPNLPYPIDEVHRSCQLFTYRHRRYIGPHRTTRIQHAQRKSRICIVSMLIVC